MHRQVRRQILRRAALYAYGLLALAIVVAVGGAAFIAWILMAAGLPFLKTWLVLSAITLGIPALGQLVLLLRRRRTAQDSRTDRAERHGG
ncbi:MAG: hypothetical protein ACRELD_04520 [Longimicrobiales bacterium]